MTKYIVKLSSKVISNEWWGQSWCENIECYSDFHNRLERGRTYLRKGAIKELQIEGGHVDAIVAGTRPEPYAVEIDIDSVPKDIAGKTLEQIKEINEFQNGVVPENYRNLFTYDKGLFPTANEIHFSCSCPDGAQLCKHVCAVLYAIGSILDNEPLLLFSLRGIKVDDYLDKRLINSANEMIININNHIADDRIIKDESISTLFGIDVLSNEAIIVEEQKNNNDNKEDIHIIEIIRKPKFKGPPIIKKRGGSHKRNTLEGFCIRQFDLDGNFLAQYNSYEEIEEKTTVGVLNIKRVCSGLRNSAGGFLWKKVLIDEPVTNIPPLQINNDIPLIRPVDCFNDDGSFVAHYDSLNSASKETGINVKSIREAAKGLQKHAGGYKWKFTDETKE